MLSTRVIPCLLLKGNGLVKTVQFKNPSYIGDPINAIKIFNDKEVDELVFLDITATQEKRGPNFKLLSEISTECFMPLGYGGGITSLGEIEKLFNLGIEKIILNSAAFHNEKLISEAIIVLPFTTDKNFAQQSAERLKSFYELTLNNKKTVETVINQDAGRCFIFLIGDVDEDGFYYQASISKDIFNPSNYKNIQYVKYY